MKWQQKHDNDEININLCSNKLLFYNITSTIKRAVSMNKRPHTTLSPPLSLDSAERSQLLPAASCPGPSRRRGTQGRRPRSRFPFPPSSAQVPLLPPPPQSGPSVVLLAAVPSPTGTAVLFSPLFTTWEKASVYPFAAVYRLRSLLVPAVSQPFAC